MQVKRTLYVLQKTSDFLQLFIKKNVFFSFGLMSSKMLADLLLLVTCSVPRFQCSLHSGYLQALSFEIFYETTEMQSSSNTKWTLLKWALSIFNRSFAGIFIS